MEYAESPIRRFHRLTHVLPLVVILALGTTASYAQKTPTPRTPETNAGVPWTATDTLGRTTRSPGKSLPNRTVGMFYFLWHDAGPEVKAPWNDGPYDIMKILANDPDALSKPASPYWGKTTGTMHYWGEPMYGYYRTDDPWVLRRHAMLLSDAGINMVIFDTTNAVIYTPMYRALCQTWNEMREQGETVPKIAFMVNTSAGDTARRIYDDLYKNGEFKELWFVWDGKPLMICDPSAADAELTAFFTLRKAHWPFKMVDTDRAWHWESAYPQPYGYVDDPKNIEQVNVSVAQNLRTAPDAQVTNMSSGNARGRSFCRGQLQPKLATDKGLNFAEQWKRVYDLKPPFVMVTGWNEWIAGNWGEPDKTLAFVDQFDREYSRDIEPMKDGHGDNYYLQLIGGIRKYKGGAPIPTVSATDIRHTMDVSNDFSQWERVTVEFRDHRGETIPRDWAGVGGTHYTNTTGRNDLVVSKVAQDDTHWYFYLESAEAFQFGNDAGVPDHLRLLLDVASVKSPMDAWLGADFCVTASDDGSSLILMERDGSQWKPTDVSVAYRVDGNRLQLAVPKQADDELDALRFKWLDNCGDAEWNMEKLYTDGDVAPESRFFYQLHEQTR